MQLYIVALGGPRGGSYARLRQMADTHRSALSYRGGCRGRPTQRGRALVARCAPPCVSSVTHAPSPGCRPGQGLDSYGGYLGRGYTPSGFFRLEHDGCWWLFTPTGQAFLACGVNHVARQRLALARSLRRSENRQHCAETVGIPPDAEAEAWQPHFQAKVAQDLATFGFNHLGQHSPTPNCCEVSVPYVLTALSADICHWLTPRAADFHDVFSPLFDDHCERVARREAAPRARDPFLIGYAFTDCPIPTDEEAAARPVRVYGGARPETPSWPRVLRNLGSQAPGRQAYVRCVRERYEDSIRSFNQAYGTQFGSFAGLAEATNWRPDVDLSNGRERKDNDAFLRRIPDRDYTVVVAAIRRHDPDHLIMGDTFNGNTNTPDFAIEVASQHTDLVLYQLYGSYAEQRERLHRWSQISRKPLMCGDRSFSIVGQQTPNSLGLHCQSQAQRAAAFAERAFARPDFVGWARCGWMDSWATVPGQVDRQHSGLQDPFGRYHQPMVSAMRDFSIRMYRIAEGPA